MFGASEEVRALLEQGLLLLDHRCVGAAGTWGTPVADLQNPGQVGKTSEKGAGRVVPGSLASVLDGVGIAKTK